MYEKKVKRIDCRRFSGKHKALGDLKSQRPGVGLREERPLNIQVLYAHNGRWRKHFPVYLIRLACDRTLALEIRGQPGAEAKANHALDQWGVP